MKKGLSKFLIPAFISLGNLFSNNSFSQEKNRYEDFREFIINESKKDFYSLDSTLFFKHEDKNYQLITSKNHSYLSIDAIDKKEVFIDNGFDGLDKYLLYAKDQDALLSKDSLIDDILNASRRYENIIKEIPQLYEKSKKLN